MDFFLPFTISNFPFKFSYKNKILLMGSCFSQEIGDRMASLKFDVAQNPNGILYNPISIANAISSYITNKTYCHTDLVHFNNIYHSFLHHSSFSGTDIHTVISKLNFSQNNGHLFLKNADVLIITFGTAFCYQLKDTGDIVGNCHKFPGGNFHKIMLDFSVIKKAYLNVIKDLKEFNPKLKIIFTISPVKHVRDGVVENVRSKARLIDVVHSIISQTDDTFYFPSYEIVTEVLRDYRFYKDDLVHPNNSAIDFVFQKFCGVFLDSESRILSKDIEEIVRMLNHRPHFEESINHHKFKNALLQKIKKLNEIYPQINFSKEKSLL